MSSLVPEGWITGKLKEFALLTKGLTYASSDYSDEHNGLPFLTLKSISKDGGYSPKGLKFYKGEFKEHHVLNFGDVLFANTDLTRNGDVVGSPLFFDGFGFSDQTLYSMDLSKLKVDPSNTDAKFLYFLLMTHRVKRWMVNSSAGSTVLHLDTKRVKEIILNLPPLPEQKKIASILTSVDEVIENTQKQIGKLQDLKKATMNELLTKGIGHTEFKDSVLGRIPKSWEVVELNDLVGSLSGGVSVNSENRNKVGSEIGVLKTSCISNGKFLPKEHKAVLSEDVHRVTTPVEANTILFSRMNTPNLVGESGYVEHSFNNLYLPDRLWALKLRDKSKTSVRWLSWLLVSRSVKTDISNAATGTSGSMKNISKPNLLSIKVRQPPVNEQFQIASVINSLEGKKANTQAKMNALVSLKKSLMQDLLTGKVRVTVN